MKKCMNCGANIPDESRFCTNCGASAEYNAYDEAGSLEEYDYYGGPSRSGYESYGGPSSRAKTGSRTRSASRGNKSMKNISGNLPLMLAAAFMLCVVIHAVFSSVYSFIYQLIMNRFYGFSLLSIFTNFFSNIWGSIPNLLIICILPVIFCIYYRADAKNKSTFRMICFILSIAALAIIAIGNIIYLFTYPGSYDAAMLISKIIPGSPFLYYVLNFFRNVFYQFNPIMILFRLVMNLIMLIRNAIAIAIPVVVLINTVPGSRR